MVGCTEEGEVRLSPVSLCHLKGPAGVSPTLRLSEVMTSVRGNSGGAYPFLRIVGLNSAPWRMSRVEMTRGHRHGGHWRGMRVVIWAAKGLSQERIEALTQTLRIADGTHREMSSPKRMRGSDLGRGEGTWYRVSGRW